MTQLVDDPKQLNEGAPVANDGEGQSRSKGPATVLKAVAVLSAFEGQSTLSLVELTKRVGMPKSTVFRLLASLIDEQIIERHRDGYQLGRRMYSLGQNALGGRPARLLDASLPLMTELQQSTGLIINVAWLQGFNVAYLATLRTRESPVTPASNGMQLPANCSALGKALLAFTPEEQWRKYQPEELPALTRRSIVSEVELDTALEAVRRDGYAVECQESSPRLACLAVPVIRQGEVVAALSVAGAPNRIEVEALRGTLKRASLHIARAA